MALSSSDVPRSPGPAASRAPDPGPAPAPAVVSGGAESLEDRLLGALPELRSYVARLVRGSAGEREDLAQEVVARALRYRDSFDRSRPLAPWLRRTALRVYLDQREARAAARTEEGQDPEPAAGGAWMAAERVEGRDELERVLARLTPIERSVLLGFHRDRRSVRELAALLSVPEGTVKSHLHRARRKLNDSEEGDSR